MGDGEWGDWAGGNNIPTLHCYQQNDFFLLCVRFLLLKFFILFYFLHFLLYFFGLCRYFVSPYPGD